MEPKMRQRRGTGLIALAALVVSGALAAPHAAWAGDKKGKVPIVIGPITTTNDPPPKKK